MKELFDQIERLTDTLHGWCEVDKAQRLAAIVLALRPAVSVEIGVYGGRSFFGMALAHKHLGHGVVIGIDPWSNDAASEGYDGENLKSWSSCPLEAIYQHFQKKCFDLAVQNVIQIHRVKSDDFEISPYIDLLHIDGQHTEQSMRDVQRYASKVRVGGIVVMDDIGWRNGADAPVSRAVDRLLDMGFVRLYPLGTGEVFQKVK